jgi:hypothetical protein
MSQASHRDLLRNAEVLGRLATFVESQRINSLPLTEALSTMGAAPGRWLRAAIDHAGEEIAASCLWPEDDTLFREWAAGRGLAPLLARATMAQPEGRLVELTLRGGAVAVTLHLPGARELDDVRAVLSGSELSDAASARLLDVAEFLAANRGGATRFDRISFAADGGVSIRIPRAVGSRDELDETGARFTTMAEELGVTAPQRTLFDQTFAILARGKKGCHFELDCSTTELHPRIRVEQRDVPFEHVLRLFVGLYDTSSGIADRLGGFAGAFKAERAASFELGFTNTEPPSARVGVELSAR